MTRRSLGVIAVVLIVLMGIVATAGLDNLPRNLRASISQASSRLDADRKTLDANRQFVEDALRREPALFAARAGEWRRRLADDRSRLDRTAAEVAALQRIAEANRRGDAAQAEKALTAFDAARSAPVADSAALRAEAEQWLAWKRDLPKRVESMRASYEAVRKADLDSGLAPVRKAMADWPAKSADLTARVDALRKAQADAEAIWQSTEAQRAQAQSGNLEGFDYAAFFAAASRLDAVEQQVTEGVQSLGNLAAQLYTGWDKILLDAGRDRGEYREKFRVVKTRYPDSTLANGQVTTEERWEQVDRAQFEASENQVGMTVARKPAGKFDSEAEKVVQPPAYAYVAPPGQSNAYGAWSGGVWHWLPQYLIFSQLLHASRPAISAGDFNAYQDARRRGSVFYGRNNEYRPPRVENRRDTRRERSSWNWGGSSSSSRDSRPTGGWYQERPKKTWGSNGGFSGSRYQSRGGYSGSRYQSRGSFSRGVGGAARSFGRGGRR